MKKSGRTLAFVIALALIAQRGWAARDELLAITGCSRSALFRLLQFGRDELGVQVTYQRGKGYTVADWGVVDAAAVVRLHKSKLKPWLTANGGVVRADQNGITTKKETGNGRSIVD